MVLYEVCKQMRPSPASAALYKTTQEHLTVISSNTFSFPSFCACETAAAKTFWRSLLYGLSWCIRPELKFQKLYWLQVFGFPFQVMACDGTITFSAMFSFWLCFQVVQRLLCSWLTPSLDAVLHGGASHSRTILSVLCFRWVSLAPGKSRNTAFADFLFNTVSGYTYSLVTCHLMTRFSLLHWPLRQGPVALLMFSSKRLQGAGFFQALYVWAFWFI